MCSKFMCLFLAHKFVRNVSVFPRCVHKIGSTTIPKVMKNAEKVLNGNWGQLVWD